MAGGETSLDGGAVFAYRGHIDFKPQPLRADAKSNEFGFGEMFSHLARLAEAATECVALEPHAMGIGGYGRMLTRRAVPALRNYGLLGGAQRYGRFGIGAARNSCFSTLALLSTRSNAIMSAPMNFSTNARCRTIQTASAVTGGMISVENW